MSRPDRGVTGPEPVARTDVDAINRVFSDAFTERYRKDGLAGVRVPQLNTAIWHFAIDDAGAGAMLWRDNRGDVVAFNIVHRAGSEGWMGPLAVRTDHQGHRLGRRIVAAGIAWLEAQGVATIGLETMPRTIDNIGFYSRLGFQPGHLTVTLQRDQPRARPVVSWRLGALATVEREVAIAACRDLAVVLGGGVDFSRELRLTLDLGLGDATLLRDPDGAIAAFALWHTAPLAQGRSRDELRILKLVAPDSAVALQLIGGVEREAAAQALPHFSLRCQSAYHEIYGALTSDGFRVRWTDLRLTLAGKGEPLRSGVVLSNWEI